MRLAAALLGSALCLTAALGAQSPPSNWDAIRSEALETLQRYVRINTSDPPGDVIKAADFLGAILEREGIPVASATNSAPGRRSSSPA